MTLCFSQKYYTVICSFLRKGVTNLFIDKQAESTGNETQAKEASESLGHLAHIIWWTEEPLITFQRKVLQNMQVFLLFVISQASYFLSPLK